MSLRTIRLRTARLELRLASHDELVALGELAVAGIHPPGWSGFPVELEGVDPSDFGLPTSSATVR